MSVCPQAYLWNRWTDLREILCADPPWPWLGFGGVALRYVFPVLWMASHLVVVGAMPIGGGCTVHRRPFERRDDTGTESDVYECMLVAYCAHFAIYYYYRNCACIYISKSS